MKRCRAISDHVCSETQRSRDIREFQRREFLDDLITRHSVRDHPDDRGHGDAETTDARHTSHLLGVDGDATHDSHYPWSRTRRESFGNVIAISQAIDGAATPMNSGSSISGMRQTTTC